MVRLISADKPQYKANLHCHSTLSDGKLTPEELKAAYKAHGYSVLAITDHEYPCDHTDLSDEDFLLFTGYEVYIRQGQSSVADAPEIHMNLFPRDPHRTAFVGYAPEMTRYMPKEAAEAAEHLPPFTPRRYTVSYVNRFIEAAKKEGFLVSYNHPYWSLENVPDILQYRGFFSMEMCNYTSFVMNRVEYNAQIYDMMLRAGTRIGCHSADDNHNGAPLDAPGSDSFGGMTMILADELSHGAIYDALEKGDFYSTMGPVIYEMTVEGDLVHVKTSPVDAIILQNGSKSPARVYPEKVGEKLTEATLKIREGAPYIRLSAFDGFKAADTRGYFPDEYRDC